MNFKRRTKDRFDEPHLQDLRIPICDAVGCSQPAEKAVVQDKRALAVFCEDHSADGLKKFAKGANRDKNR